MSKLAILTRHEGFVECPKAKPFKSEDFPELTFYLHHTYQGNGEFSKSWTVSEGSTGASLCTHIRTQKDAKEYVLYALKECDPNSFRENIRKIIEMNGENPC